MEPDKETLKLLSTIPGVGRSVAFDFYQIGIRKIEDLQGQNAEQLYDRLNQTSGFIQNKCFLYVFRCAIYFAETPQELQEKEKLNWWYWKEGK